MEYVAKDPLNEGGEGGEDGAEAGAEMETAAQSAACLVDDDVSILARRQIMRKDLRAG